jgi:hypothetical protein
MQTKIKITTASETQFCEIFRRVARSRQLHVDEAVLKELVGVIRDTLRQELRGCQPRDLVNQVCWAARYEDREPVLSLESLIAAVEAYFIPLG